MFPAKQILLVSVLFVVQLQVAQGARILFLLGIASHSHRVCLDPLAERLAREGHEVTFLSPLKPAKAMPGIRELELSSNTAVKNAADDIAYIAITSRLRQKNYDHNIDGDGLFKGFYETTKEILKNPDFHKFFDENPLDLIIPDYPIKELGHALAYKYKTKIILFHTESGQLMADHDAYGLDPENTWNPDLTWGSTWLPDRVIFTYNTFLWYFVYKWEFLPKIDELVRVHMGKDIPPVGDLLQDIDLILLNEHFSSGHPRSLPPYVVPVGGLHAEDSNGTLPKPIQNFLDKRPSKSFVFISFGSILKITDLPPEFQKSLFDAIATFQDVSFLWKWEGTLPKNGPANVLFMNWFPQQDVLANPNCLAFVTQAGAMSYQQGIYHGVPMLVVPVWFDQVLNARSTEHHGVGIHLELADINKDTFRQALERLLHDEKFSKNAKEVARRTKARPMHPAETALWWTEYVLNHDTAHLKSPAIRQTWWQRRLLDIWALLFTSLILTVYIGVKIMKKALALIQGNLRQQKKKTS